MAPEDRVMVERPIVPPADVRTLEDLPVVAADVERVPDGEDEEEQEERHRQRDEPVADQRLPRPLVTEPPRLPSFRDCDRHSPPLTTASRAPLRTRGEAV